DLPEVDEVREDVRRVRQEEEPYDPGRGEQPTRRSGSVETDEPEREQVGHPGEEEVPEEEGEGRRARALGTDVLEAPGEQRPGHQQRGQARQPRDGTRGGVHPATLRTSTGTRLGAR